MDGLVEFVKDDSNDNEVVFEKLNNLIEVF